MILYVAASIDALMTKNCSLGTSSTTQVTTTQSAKKRTEIDELAKNATALCEFPTKKIHPPPVSVSTTTATMNLPMAKLA